MSLYAHLLMPLLLGMTGLALLRYCVFMLGSAAYEHRFRSSKRPLPDAECPTMAILIPAHNEGPSVLNSVRSALNADYPKDKLQLVVIDDGSTDDTLAVLREEQQWNNFTVIAQHNQGKAHALNNAMGVVRAELVMCLDADSTLRADAPRRAARYFVDPKVQALCANVRIRRTGRLLNLIQYAEYVIGWQMKRALTVYNAEYIVGGIGSVFRRSAIESAGYYDTDTMVEDMDLTLKLRRMGRDCRIVFGADVICTTEAVVTVSDLMKQRYRWKYGHLQALWKHRELFFSRKAPASLAFIYLPYVLLSELILFAEPFVQLFVVGLLVFYGDFYTPCAALAAVSSSMMMYIMAEHQLPLRARLKLVAQAPGLYVLFFLLTAVWYVSLLRTYAKLPRIMRQPAGDCRWQHVERAKV